MSDMLERPQAVQEATGDLNDFIGTENLDLGSLEEILAGLAAETSVPWDKVPVATPAESHEIPADSWFISHEERVLTEEPDAVSGNTPAKQYRNGLRSYVEKLGGATDEMVELADNLQVAASETIANGRFHSHVPGETYAAECRLKRYIEHVGPTAVKLVLVFETENRREILDIDTVSSGQEQTRGQHEGGRGFGVIKQLTELSGGKFGRYIKERFVTPPAESDTAETDRDEQAQRCAVWVTWASFSATVDASKIEIVD